MHPNPQHFELHEIVDDEGRCESHGLFDTLEGALEWAALCWLPAWEITRAGSVIARKAPDA